LIASSQSGNSKWVNILEAFDKNEAKNYQTILAGHGKIVVRKSLLKT